MSDVCERCADHLAANPSIVGACASVGIEHGRSTASMVQQYMRRVHIDEGHR